MPERAFDIVGPERTADAAFIPARAEHEVVDDQLAAAAEQAGQRLFAVRSIEQVILLYFDPGQFTALGTEPVSRPRKFLFVREMRLAQCGPFLARDDFVRLHGGSC